ncbi:hypothetical protein [Winogradskyella forsetii]|uniref:hypothetical protein n=1 Tax=Winogradskyella forsetii TaxID=2686077 RepID=UPI0015BD72D2|nr:hypothetical protein [Winogradskyella forsetii]
MKKWFNTIIRQNKQYIKQRPDLMKHLGLGHVSNIIVILALGLILVNGINFNVFGLIIDIDPMCGATPKLICWLACLIPLILWEWIQKKRGGTNTTKEQMVDIFFGWVSAFYLSPIIIMIIEKC